MTGEADAELDNTPRERFQDRLFPGVPQGAGVLAGFESINRYPNEGLNSYRRIERSVGGRNRSPNGKLPANSSTFTGSTQSNRNAPPHLF